MPLDLSKLDQDLLLHTAPVAEISAFEEDSDNPRKEFDGPAFDSLVKDIALRGILQPPMVALRPDGRLRIHFGARRYRAAIRAGLTEIPYLVISDQRQLDGYAQVAENEQRSPLQPMELAQFIATRLKTERKKDIAAKLHVDPSTITHLLSLIDAPHFVLELYYSNRCRSPFVLYQLRKLHALAPDHVEKSAIDAPTIDRALVNAIAQQIHFSHLERSPIELPRLDAENLVPLTTADLVEEATPLARVRHTGGRTSTSKKQGTLRNPVLVGTYRGSEVILDLRTRPSQVDRIYVLDRSSSASLEVSLTEIVLSNFVEAAVKTTAAKRTPRASSS